MDTAWTAILNRYGRTVTVCEGETRAEVRAFLQPIGERGREQNVPTPLGLHPEERLLYLGPKDRQLTADVSVVEWNGRRYDVCSAHPVGGADTHHWWAVLCPEEVSV